MAESQELHKTGPTERVLHIEIPCRGTIKNRSEYSRHAKRARGTMVPILPDKGTNMASRGSRAQSVPGITLRLLFTPRNIPGIHFC
jgi:hypothetical protein